MTLREPVSATHSKLRTKVPPSPLDWNRFETCLANINLLQDVIVSATSSDDPMRG